MNAERAAIGLEGTIVFDDFGHLIAHVLAVGLDQFGNQLLERNAVAMSTTRRVARRAESVGCCWRMCRDTETRSLPLLPISEP